MTWERPLALERAGPRVFLVSTPLGKWALMALSMIFGSLVIGGSTGRDEPDKQD